MLGIDFLPEKIKIRRARRQRLQRHGCMLAVCLVGLASLAVIREGMVGQAKGEQKLLANRGQNLRKLLDSLGGLQTQQARLMIKKRISDQLGSNVNAMEVLSELERVLDNVDKHRSMVLTRLELEAMQLSVPVAPAPAAGPAAVTAGGNIGKRERKVNRVRLLIVGLATSDVAVANFIAQLSANRLFEEVNMGYTKTVSYGKQMVREFQASCYVVRTDR